jgi:hypothetical protein
MIIRGRWRATDYTVSLKESSLAVAIGEQPIIVCDHTGRLYSLYTDSRHHRRSLSGQVLQKWQGSAGRERQWLDQAAADVLIDFAADQLQQLLAALSALDWTWLTPPDQSASLTEIVKVIERGAQFDHVRARSDAARFAEVYSPIGILPPDQYLALVLQATDGCSFNTCAFCDLYHQAFRIKMPDEFRQHLKRVREYLGESILLRQRSIFLGAANALAIPMPRLLPIFEIVAQEFPLSVRKRGKGEGQIGVYAFLDAFTGTRKSIDDYRALAELGLKRVYIGLESGHDPLLEFVRKPGHAHDAIDTVQSIKAAGVNVGVIVMIGLGGDRFAEGHVVDTNQVLSEMQLGTGDLLYFSDLVEEPTTLYPTLAAQHSIRALNVIERNDQRAAIRKGLRLQGVKVSNYDVREFVY